MNIQIKCDDDICKDMWDNHPTYESSLKRGDSGLDIPLPHEVVVPAKALGYKVSLGIKTSQYDPFMLFPRSSISKTPIRLSNSVGLIDQGYRGPLMAVVDNHSDSPFTLEAGKCYFQIVNFHANAILWQIVDELDLTERGENGFGSTTDDI